MGCTASNFSYDTNESSYGTNMPSRSMPRKRNFSSRVECTQSSALPTEHTNSSASTWSSCSTPPPPRSCSTPNKKKRILPKRPAFLKLSRKDMPKALARLTLSDRTQPEPTTPPRQHKRIMEQSIGYFTGSTDDLDSSCSSFSYDSLLLNTQDMSRSSASVNSSDSDTSNGSEPVSNLKMEILMMRENVQLMPKTSSPFCVRRDFINCAGSEVNFANFTPPSDTYCLWRQYLQDTPDYSFGNVTAIPEAIAGQFSPENHPAYTKLQNFECVSAPKRYRVQVRKANHAAPRMPLAAAVPDCGVTRSTISTEL
ncbi:uncharacterized protein LOC105212259 [Zeugodacus cucurbitae]|uniref:uncharacterized protein LOC105212259 n=1 Tax=Zeugodacus cucurbitae TaxID=28588 RepID=UPI000596925F|nr:uncharacterized protein LOC105212259 [Zeugodacus cucurbitae]